MNNMYKTYTQDDQDKQAGKKQKQVMNTKHYTYHTPTKSAQLYLKHPNSKGYLQTASKTNTQIKGSGISNRKNNIFNMNEANQQVGRFKTDFDQLNNEFKFTVTPTSPRSPYQSNRKRNEQFYQAQTEWLREKEERNYSLKIEKEKERSPSKETFQPKITKKTKDIINKKYKFANFEQRQQYYYIEKKQREILQKIEQEEQMRQQQVRMSPKSRIILRSITPKTYRSTNAYSFSGTNVSYFQQ